MSSAGVKGFELFASTVQVFELKLSMERTPRRITRLNATAYEFRADRQGKCI